MKSKKSNKYRDEKGRFISEEKLSKKLARNGLTLSDYEKGRKAVKRFGSKNPVKALFESFKALSTERQITENYTDTIKSLRNLPKNKGRAYLNGKRLSKRKLMIFLSDFPKKFNKDFYFFLLNTEFSNESVKVNIDNEIVDLVNDADGGDRVEDKYGNEVQISS